MSSMRVSVDRNDPGFPRYAELVSDGYAVRVTVDGVEIPRIVTADEDEGIVIAQRITPEGNPVCVEDVNVYDRLRGEVRIIVTRPNDDRTLH